MLVPFVFFFFNDTATTEIYTAKDLRVGLFTSTEDF